MKKGQEISVDGQMAEFIEKKGGWVTILDSEGKVRKVRASKVSELTTKTVKATEDDDDDDVVRLHPNMDNYVKGLGSTPSGRDTIDIDDDVAKQLRGMDFSTAAKAVARAMNEMGEKTTGAALIEKYEHLNPGMQRMNLGNKLRGAIKRAEA